LKHLPNETNYKYLISRNHIMDFLKEKVWWDGGGSRS